MGQEPGSQYLQENDNTMDISKIISEEIQQYARGVIRESMTTLEMLAQAYNRVLNGIETYICARNQDAGLRDPKVEASLRRGLNALKRQYDRELKVARKRRR